MYKIIVKYQIKFSSFLSKGAIIDPKRHTEVMLFCPRCTNSSKKAAPRIDTAMLLYAKIDF